MVKSSLIVASLATAGSVVMAQSATPTTANGATLPTAMPSNLSGVPSGVADAVSSLLKNPAGINSYISAASQQVSQLPSQYQASAYSALSAASKSVAAIQPTKSTGATSAAGSNAAPVSFAVGALALIAVFASLL
ncbi:uncharacterized protein ATC70_012709 [Mucor velutinosus]|uniref:Uncharacterized protein n=1 Tax=Mucor velutinosus TaxID=708070 RepID=A0AAN7D6N9_9FUNG|nr:hypothetical protein ATC70_012709 [Mucor velutinosus]